MARDYKNAKGRGSKNSGTLSFFVGLGLGLLVAVVIHFYDKRDAEKQQRAASAVIGQQGKESKPAPASQSAEPQEHLDFYDMLPKFEVVVPEKDKDVKRNVAGTVVDKPGAYVLQAGSYRNFADADRIRALLALQGVESKVQKVTVDADTWHRVRIGPIRNLKQLDETRRKVREAQLDAIVIRVGD